MQKDYSGNPSTIFVRIVDNSAVACDEIINVTDSVSTNVINTISTNVTSTVSINSNKRYKK